LLRLLRMQSSSAPCGSRRGASTHGLPTSAGCGISAKPRANFAGGYRGLADARGFAFASHQTLNLAEGLNSREMLARRAVELDSADAEAHSALAHVLAGRGDYQGGLVEAKRALAMTPNLSIAHGALGSDVFWSTKGRIGFSQNRHKARSPRLTSGS
jgi:hypothetical protein